MQEQKHNVVGFYQAYRDRVENRPTTASTQEANKETQYCDKGERAEHNPGLILVTQGQGARLIVRLPYSAERIAKIKTITGRLWHPKEQYWSVPHTDTAIPHLIKVFAGEPVEVDPSLRAERIRHDGEASWAARATVLNQLREALRSRHYGR